MLRTLLESRRRKTPNEFATAASTGIHLTIIVVAAYMTVAHKAVTEQHDPVPKLHWVNPLPPEQTSHPSAHRNAAGTGAPNSVRNAPAVSFAIAATIPGIDIPLGMVRSVEFASSTGFETADESGESGDAHEKSAYDFYEVESQASAIPGAAPEYPAALRSAGIEGEVLAQFIVDQNGLAEPGSLRIVSASNELFANSVRRALPRMRFTPARLGGRAVPQMVQQTFVFRLNR